MSKEWTLRYHNQEVPIWLLELESVTLTICDRLLVLEEGEKDRFGMEYDFGGEGYETEEFVGYEENLDDAKSRLLATVYNKVTKEFNAYQTTLNQLTEIKGK